MRRCQERGVKCPGYAFNLRWAPKNQLHPPSPSASSYSQRHTVAHTGSSGLPANVRQRQTRLLSPKTGLVGHPSTGMDARIFHHSWLSRSPTSLLISSPSGAQLPASPDAWSYSMAADSLFPGPHMPQHLSLEGQLPLIPEPSFQPWPQGPVYSESLWNEASSQPPILLCSFGPRDLGPDEEEDEVEGVETSTVSSITLAELITSSKDSQTSTIVSVPQEVVNVPSASALRDHFFNEIISL
ncbi:unnamed protein product [Clonostachys rosea]|uniref:Zn(2)-C6 fungal-type domain-containing protein n=1 Tax=Bionectria ochroleuca TaxID=29856 RepID=A0ABY6UFJ5_BIOOC|nr:unnamed protein product [Clonostachys rosea]